MFIAAGGKQGSKLSLPHHFLDNFFSFDFKTFINSQIYGGFLLSKNKQAYMAQGPNASHEVLHLWPEATLSYSPSTLSNI